MKLFKALFFCWLTLMLIAAESESYPKERLIEIGLDKAMKEYKSGQFSEALTFWDLRKTISASPNLSVKYPRELIREMLDEAADHQVPRAQFMRFLTDAADKERKQRISDLKSAYDNGITEAGALLSLVLSFIENDSLHAKAIADHYFKQKSKDSSLGTLSIEDVNLFYRIISQSNKIGHEVSGEELFKNEELISSWNLWNYSLRRKTQK